MLDLIQKHVVTEFSNACSTSIPLQLRHTEPDGVSNHQPAIVYSTVYSGADQGKHESSASLAFMRGIHRWLVNSPHKRPVTRKMLSFDDVIMPSILCAAGILSCIIEVFAGQFYPYNSGILHQLSGNHMIRPVPKEAILTDMLYLILKRTALTIKMKQTTTKRVPISWDIPYVNGFNWLKLISPGQMAAIVSDDKINAFS